MRPSALPQVSLTLEGGNGRVGLFPGKWPSPRLELPLFLQVACLSSLVCRVFVFIPEQAECEQKRAFGFLTVPKKKKK